MHASLAKRPWSRRRLLTSTLALGVLMAGCSQPPASVVPTTNAAPSVGPTSQPTAPASPSSAPVLATTSSAVVNIDGPFEGEAKVLNGAGATFPAVLYTKWFTEYNRLTGVSVNYQAIGSGGGIKAITDGTVDFGATDGPMTDEQLRAAGVPMLHIPTTLGAVVPTYNVPEMGDRALRFTAETLAGIFLGTITKWNDPEIVAHNPDLRSVDQNILVVHRSDGSGTTYCFTDYLATVSPEWADKVGKGTSVDWPTGLGSQGNAGVAGEVKQNLYSIGYVELIYALQNRLGIGQVRNRAGNFVTPSVESTTAAAAVAKMPDDLRASIVDPDGDHAYPIATLSWILVPQTMPRRPEAIALTRLLWWAAHDGQKLSGELFYAPLPDPVVAKVEQQIRRISVGGEKAFPER